MRIVFQPQNLGHLRNFLAIAQRLGGGVESRFVLVDDVSSEPLHERFEGADDRFERVRIGSGNIGTFYRAGALERLRILRRHAPELQRAVAAADALIVGNDGAVQRIMIDRVRRDGGRVGMMIDGLLFASRRFTTRPAYRIAFRLAARLGLSPWLPSEIGYSRPNRVWTMHESAAEVVRRAMPGVPVISGLLPRHESLRTAVDHVRRAAPRGDRALLYAMSAFGWHGHWDDAERQRRDIEYLAAVRHDTAVPIRVRLHPRTEADEIAFVRDTGLTVSDAETPLETDLGSAVAVTSPRSSLLHEAVLADVPASVFVRHFSPDTGNALLDALPCATDLTSALDVTAIKHATIPAALSLAQDVVEWLRTHDNS